MHSHSDLFMRLQPTFKSEPCKVSEFISANSCTLSNRPDTSHSLVLHIVAEEQLDEEKSKFVTRLKHLDEYPIGIFTCLIANLMNAAVDANTEDEGRCKHNVLPQISRAKLC